MLGISYGISYCQSLKTRYLLNTAIKFMGKSSMNNESIYFCQVNITLTTGCVKGKA